MKVKVKKNTLTGRGKLIVNNGASGGPFYSRTKKKLIKTIGKYIRDLPAE